MVYNQITINKRNSVLLFLLFFIILTSLGYIFGYIFEFGYTGVVFGFIFALVSALISYYYGDKLVLNISRAREVKKKEYPFLVNTIEGLSLGYGIPMPRVYVMPGNQINAFATGRDPKNASISVTEGALDKLNKEELEGVLSHEISHIKNLDIRLMVLTAIMVGTIVMISDFFLRSVFFTRQDDRGKGNIQIILFIIGIFLAILSPIFAQLIKLAISRKREYLADSSGALLTKNPKGLANALRKIMNDKDILRTANHATAHLFISNPFKSKKDLFTNLFSTHPPLNERIKKLEDM